MIAALTAAAVKHLQMYNRSTTLEAAGNAAAPRVHPVPDPASSSALRNLVGGTETLQFIAYNSMVEKLNEVTHVAISC